MKSSDSTSEQANSGCNPACIGTLGKTMLCLVLGLAVILLGIRLFSPNLLTPVVIQRVQLFVFPLVLVLLWSLRVRLGNVPRFALGLAAVGSVTATALAYHLQHNSTGRQVVVARLSDDKDESETRVFGSALSERPLVRDPVAITRFFKSFSKDKEVRKLFVERSNLAGVIWGSTRWANVSLPERAPQPLSAFKNFTASPRLKDLSLVRSVPIFGISNPTSRGSRIFLAEVLNAGDDEVLLQKAATVQDHWTTPAHRAYPLWRAGTENLLKYLETGGDSPGYLECADKLFAEAQGLLRWGDNPDLLAAVYNNRAVGNVLMVERSGDVSGLALATQGFKNAIATKRQPNRFRIRYRAMRVASENHKILRGTPVKAKNSKNKNKKKKKVNNAH